MKLLYLSNKIPWFGKYSGYECLPNYLPSQIEASIVYPKVNTINRILGKCVKIKYDWDFINPYEAFAEIIFKNRINRYGISHILYLENHLHLFKQFDLKKSNVFGTIHLPISRWKEEQLCNLDKINNLIFLYKEELEAFGRYVNIEKLRVIKHGVDINFLKPGDQAQVKRNKILFVGHFLRNFDMFYKVYEIIEKEISDAFEYHFIIPEIHRDNIILNKLSYKKNIFFHQKLSDEELLSFYQSSSMLLMPMNDSGANTAIVQAIATGLPILTTDVGGIRSYGGGDIYPVIANNDSYALAELFAKYYYGNDLRNKQSLLLRNYAINNLDWYKIALQHSEAYYSINND